MSDPEETIDRRTFLTKSAALLAGGAAFASTALSYDRILGANDRISVVPHRQREPGRRSGLDRVSAEDQPQRGDDHGV